MLCLKPGCQYIFRKGLTLIKKGKYVVGGRTLLAKGRETGRVKISAPAVPAWLPLELLGFSQRGFSQGRYGIRVGAR